MDCSISNCQNVARARSYCTLHYQRWKRTGDPEATVRKGPEAVRFWRKVDKGAGCWRWRGAINVTSGYGVFQRGDGRGTVMAHRWAYESERGAIPAGLQIDHLCRTRRCVRPDHLEVVTQRENLMRGETVTARNAAKTHCPQGHEYTPDNTYDYTGRGAGRGRSCKTCQAERSRRAYQRRRSK